MRHAKHIFRLIILIVVLLSVISITLKLFVPKSFGKYGHYRADNLKEQMELPVVWQGVRNESCVECHQDETYKKMASRHKNVPCMNCHGPISKHVSVARKRIAEMPIIRSWKHCARCHQKLAARAKVIPQVDVVEHLREQGEKLDKNICIECHNPHNPQPE